jgi:hypothetical protein
MSVKKIGVLKKDTFIYFAGSPTLTAPKGARVVAEGGVLKIEGVPFSFVALPLRSPCPYRKNCGERCQGMKVSKIFFARGEDGEPPLRVVFPDGGPIPYPFSLL